MTGMLTASAVALCLLAILALVAWWWVVALVSVYQWFLSRPAFSRAGVSLQCSLPGEGDHEAESPEQPHRKPCSRIALLSSSLGARCTAALVAAGLVFGCVVPSVAAAYTPGPYAAECQENLTEDFEEETFDPENEEDVAEVESCEFELEHPDWEPPDTFGRAVKPDFDSFFGGMRAAVVAGGVVVIALVVVLAVRRLTSF